MKTGIIYLKIKIKLNYDMTEEEAQEMVEDLDYDFNDTKNRIATTEIVDLETNI